MVEKGQPLPQSSMARELEGTSPASKDSHSGHSLDALLAPLRVPFGSLEASWVCRGCLMPGPLNFYSRKEASDRGGVTTGQASLADNQLSRD